jgi:hypothetical protein
VVIHIIIVVTHETIDGHVPFHNNIQSSLWFRTAIVSSPFYNMIVPIFIITGYDVTVPSSSILSEPFQHMQVTMPCMQHAGMIQHHHACLNPEPTLVHQSSHHLLPNELSIFPKFVSHMRILVDIQSHSENPGFSPLVVDFAQ